MKVEWNRREPLKSEEELVFPTRKPTRESEISSDEDEGERKIAKRILEDIDGLQQLFTFEEETSSEEEEEEEEADQAEEEAEIEEPSDDETTMKKKETDNRTLTIQEASPRAPLGTT